MSTELTKYTPPKALVLEGDAVVKVQNALKKNLQGAAMSEFDLPRVKINTGTALWLVPDMSGEVTIPHIECVVPFARDMRVYWASKDAGNVPPDCSSRDGITGNGKPGGACKECPFSKFDSAPEGGPGQACKQIKKLFILRGESLLPEMLSLPPTSSRPFLQQMLRIAGSGLEYDQVLWSFELEKLQSQQGKPYGRLVPKAVRPLSEVEMERVREYTRICEQIAGADPSVVDLSQ